MSLGKGKGKLVPSQSLAPASAALFLPRLFLGALVSGRDPLGRSSGASPPAVAVIALRVSLCAIISSERACRAEKSHAERC